MKKQRPECKTPCGAIHSGLCLGSRRPPPPLCCHNLPSIRQQAIVPRPFADAELIPLSPVAFRASLSPRLNSWEVRASVGRPAVYWVEARLAAYCGALSESPAQFKNNKGKSQLFFVPKSPSLPVAGQQAFIASEVLPH